MSKKEDLIKLYADMASNGYSTIDDQHVEVAFSDMEVRAFKDVVKPIFEKFNIKSILDYGCGGSDYLKSGFSGQLSAKDFFNIDFVHLFEPARNIDERQKSDAVLCFDVLEHIFISDIPKTIRELFTLSKSVLIVNVACYSARALLPNGENAHITVRPPLWWKGMIDSIAIEFPNVSVQLWCSTGWRKVEAFKLVKALDWEEQEGFVVTL
jgi:hypothetical protein